MLALQRLARIPALAVLLLLLTTGCSEAGDPSGGVADRSAATQAAEADRNLAASQTAQARPPAAPRP